MVAQTHLYKALTTVAMIVALILCLCLISKADVITFDTHTRGEVMTMQVPGVTFSTINNHPCHPDKLVVFDSHEPVATAAQKATPGYPSRNDGDPDLAFPWAGGNLVGIDLSKFLVIAENDRDIWTGSGTTTGPADGFIDVPDDEACGGTFIIQFAFDIEAFGFDEIDHDETAANSVLELYDNGTMVYSRTFAQLATLDNTISFGNRYANRMPLITASAVGSVFDEARIKAAGSRAIDNIRFEAGGEPQVEVVPEPATLALFGAGLTITAFAARRRRRRAK